MADFPFFKTAAVRHLGFSKVENFNFRSGSEPRRPNVRHLAKFREDRFEPFRRYGLACKLTV